MNLVLIALLILLNWIFVAAEFSLVKVRSSQVEIEAKWWSINWKIVQDITKNIKKYLWATQLWVTLCSLWIWRVWEDVFTKYIIEHIKPISMYIPEYIVHMVWIFLAFLLITILQISFWELAPRAIAIKNPLKAALYIWAPLKIFYIIFKPIIWFMNLCSDFVLSIFGIEPIHENEIHSEEELKVIIAESEEWWAIQASEHELIQNVFDFDNRTVSQIKRNENEIVAIDIKDDLGKMIKIMLDEWYSRYPVYEWDIDNIIWVIHAKDLFRYHLTKSTHPLRSLVKSVIFVPGNQKISELLKIFQTTHKLIAIVTNEFGSTEWIVTMEDILEELVWEIQDEHDDEKPLIEKIKEDEYLVNTMVTIIDANEFLPHPIPENSEYQTISWYINYLFGKIPAEWEEIVIDNYRIKIVKRKKQIVELARLKHLWEE